MTQDCQIMIDMFWNVVIAMNQRCISFCEYFFTYKVHLLYILKFYKPYLTLLLILAFIWPVLFDFFQEYSILSYYSNQGGFLSSNLKSDFIGS